MKVILQKDVKNVGKVGEMVNVKDGFARNYLFPRKFAVEATEKRMKEWEHLQKVAEVRKKKAQAERQELISKIQGLTLNFKSEAGAGDKLFGAVTNINISDELERQGFMIDRRDIVLEEPIKVLGQHQVKVKLGTGLEAQLIIVVERT